MGYQEELALERRDGSGEIRTLAVRMEGCGCAHYLVPKTAPFLEFPAWNTWGERSRESLSLPPKHSCSPGHLGALQEVITGTPPSHTCEAAWWQSLQPACAFPPLLWLSN